MKSKIIQSIPALLALAVIGFSYFSQWCTPIGQICFRTVIDRVVLGVTYPLYFFSLFFLPIAFILIFVPRAVFISWLKFAAWSLPLLFIFVATQPVYTTHILSTNRDDAARLAGAVFAVISLILIIWKWIAARRHGSI